MPTFRPSTVAIALIAFAVTALVPPSRAQDEDSYAEPDFETELFSRDALLLETQEIATTVTALAAIASNFPGTDKVNHRLRAKSLAVALRLDGTHPAAVSANSDLRDGKHPEPLTDFTDLDAIAEQLWTAARYLESPEKGKDERILQFCLAEIARDLDPENLADSNLYPAHLPSNLFPGWSAIIGKGDKPVFEFDPGAGDPGNKTDPEPEPETTTVPTPNGTGNPTRTAQGTLRTAVAGDSRGSVATLTGDLKAGGGTDALAIVFADVEGETNQPLNRYRDTLVSALTELHGSWPQDGGVLVLTVKSDDADDQGLMLGAAILADSLMRERELDPRVLPIGFVAPEGSLMAVDNLFERLQALKTAQPGIVIVPEENLPQLQDMLLLGEIPLFFRHQFIVASTLKEAAAMVAVGREENFETSLVEAKLVWDVVKGPNVATMPKYSAVRKKLTLITELNPRHVSASLLLKQGADELPEKLTLGGSLAALQRATGPVVAAMQDQGSADRATAAAALAEVNALKPLIPTEAETLSSLMTGVLEDIGTYAGLTDQNSAAATELQAKIRTSWATVRTEFGRLKNRDE